MDAPAPGAGPRALASFERGHAAVAVLWAAAMLVVVSDGGVSMLDAAAIGVGGIFALVWLVAFLIRWGWSGKAESGLARPWRLPRVGLPPLALLAVLVGAGLDLPFRARFAASRGALERWARAVEADPAGEAGHRVGLFRLRAVDRAGEAVRVVLAECGLDECGVAWSPGGPPPVLAEDLYAEMGGGWWRWRRSW